MGRKIYKIIKRILEIYKEDGAAVVIIKVYRFFLLLPSRRLKINFGVFSNIAKLKFYQLLTSVKCKFNFNPFSIFAIKKVYPIGYASRSITTVLYNGQRFILTADVGDDSVSVLSLDRKAGCHRKVVTYPPLSAPIAVASIKSSNSSNDSILVSIFNYDAEGITSNKCQLLLYRDLEHLTNFIEAPQIVIEREGHWGYRSISVLANDGIIFVATVDRLKGELHILEFSEDGLVAEEAKKHVVDLNYENTKAIPIFSAILSQSESGKSPLFIINKQGKNELTFVEKNNDLYHIHRRLKIKGVSRSNVVIGEFRFKHIKDVAIALWGGDPNKFYDKSIGEICIVQQNGAKEFNTVTYFNGGVHPTDVVAGDFDGDGLDELAVLNYGTGMNPLDRGDSGGVQIFKFINDAFHMISELPLPNPRVGLSCDVDGEGGKGLLVSLFFDKKLILLEMESMKKKTTKHPK